MKKTLVGLALVSGIAGLALLVIQSMPQRAPGDAIRDRQAPVASPDQDGRREERILPPQIGSDQADVQGASDEVMARGSPQSSGDPFAAAGGNRGFAPSDAARAVVPDPRASRIQRLQMMAQDTVEALPGLAGYTFPISMAVAGGYNPAKMLATETRDPYWAAVTENAIIQRLVEATDSPMLFLDVECRASTCGLVFRFPATSDPSSARNLIGQKLADDLQFPGYYTGSSRAANGDGFVVVYLGAWPTPRFPEGETGVPQSPTSAPSEDE